jgi:hypothetical protein
MRDDDDAPAIAAEVRCLEDLDRIRDLVGLPVGPRIGPGKRTKEKKEWYRWKMPQPRARRSRRITRTMPLNERLAVWFVKWRYDPWTASEALLRVSNTLHRYGQARADAEKNLEKVTTS